MTNYILLFVIGNIESPDVISGRIDDLLVRREANEVNDLPLGYFTAENRNTWATYRSQLLTTGNADSLELVDSALFCVCLDSSSTSTFDAENPAPIIRDQLFGNAGNRWFDKSFSLIIASDGTTSVNFEHSWGDGVAVMRYCNDVYRDVTTKPYVMTSDNKPSSSGAVDEENVRRIGEKCYRILNIDHIDTLFIIIPFQISSWTNRSKMVFIEPVLITRRFALAWMWAFFGRRAWAKRCAKQTK